MNAYASLGVLAQLRANNATNGILEQESRTLKLSGELDNLNKKLAAVNSFEEHGLVSQQESSKMKKALVSQLKSLIN